MRLIPPIMAESTRSDGERAVFEALAASERAGKGVAGGPAGGSAAGPDTTSWTVLHSFDIAEHRRRLAGEIDFLCLVRRRCRRDPRRTPARRRRSPCSDRR